MNIHFSFQKPATIINRNKLKKFIESIFISNKKKLKSLNYILCSDEYLLEINQQYLMHDEFTDIITFDLSEDQENISAEIYVSIDRVKENALIYKTSILQELHRVIFHGALHLCGFKDKKPKEISEMRKQEDKLLNNYLNVPRIPVPGRNKK